MSYSCPLLHQILTIQYDHESLNINAFANMLKVELVTRPQKALDYVHVRMSNGS
jgi:hypothetical protein